MVYFKDGLVKKTYPKPFTAKDIALIIIKVLVFI